MIESTIGQVKMESESTMGQVKKDDLVSRQAAIDYFVTNVGFHDEDGYPIEDSDELRKIWTEYFDGIPSVQPIDPVKHGKWKMIDKGNMFFVPHILQCSICGNVLDTHGVNAGRGDANYCPVCGAKMERSEE